MEPDDRSKHWRTLAEGHLESAATLYRDGNYAQMFHHCYVAVQSALEAAVVARRVYRVPTTVSLVVMAQGLASEWTVSQRETMIELTNYARSVVEGSRFNCPKDRSLETLRQTVDLVRALLT